MLDLPPPQQPTQEVQKMDKKNILIQKIKTLCEASMQLKSAETEQQCNLSGRAFFLDICNAANANEIFSFKVASWLTDICKDGFDPRAVTNYDLLAYHIDDNDLRALDYTLNNEGNGDGGLARIPECDSCAPRVIYTIMVDNPDFTPKFTRFTFGGTMKDMPPLRLEDGKPNPEFFRKWSSETEKMFE